MTCSPSYHGEPRQYVSNPCNHNCFHWLACLKELKLPEDYKSKVWIEKPATKKEIKKGEFHIDRKYNEGGFNPKVKYLKWHII